MKSLLLITVITLSVFSGWCQSSFTKGAVKDFAVRLATGKADGAAYSWSVSPEGATSTNLASENGSSVRIVWDGNPGDYTLTVSVVDGNGCIGESISQQIRVLESGDLIFAADYPNTRICSDLSGDVEGSVPVRSESMFAIRYGGDANLVSAKVSVQNPNGEYVDLSGTVLANQQNPELTINNVEEDKQIDFAVADQWENTGNAEVQFTLKLISAVTSDSAEIPVSAGTDITRTIGVLQKPVIQFN